MLVVLSPFADQLLLELFFGGILQIVLALGVAALIFLIFRDRRRLILRWFLYFNVVFFCWSALGNATWLGLTWGRMAVLDDAPVWSPFIPFGKQMLDHAAGDSDGWWLIGETTLRQLQGYWLATALPVWLLSFLSMSLWSRMWGGLSMPVVLPNGPKEE